MSVTRCTPLMRRTILRMNQEGSFRSLCPARTLVRNNTSAVGGAAQDEGTKPTAPESILLYEKKSKRLIRISSAASVISGIYWATYVATMEGHLQTVGYTPEPWGYLGIGMTGIMIFSSNTFANKMVGKISYLPGASALAISTHSFSGRLREPRVVDVGSIILPEARRKSTYMPFKVKGDYAYTLIDKDDGVFHNREMLMNLLGGNLGDGALRKGATGQIVEVDEEETRPQNPKAGRRGKARSR